MPQTFFHSSCSRKHDLMPLTLYHWQPYISRFCASNTKILLSISVSSLGLQVPVAVAKFLDLVRLLTAIPVGKLWVLY